MSQNKTEKRYVTCIGLRNDEEKAKIEQVCSDIKQGDPSFIYDISASKLSQYKWVLRVASKDQVTAKRRGGWLIGRTGYVTCSLSRKPCRKICPLFNKKCERKQYGLKFWVKTVEEKT